MTILLIIVVEIAALAFGLLAMTGGVAVPATAKQNPA
jgi:hypothetical protein